MVSVISTCKPLRTVWSRLPMNPVQLLGRDCAERTLTEVMSMSVYCHAPPLTSFRRTLTTQKVVTSGDSRRILAPRLRYVFPSVCYPFRLFYQWSQIRRWVLFLLRWKRSILAGSTQSDSRGRSGSTRIDGATLRHIKDGRSN